MTKGSGNAPILWVLVAIAGLAFAQGVVGGRRLVLSGSPGEAPVVEVNGASYVAVEALARLANASVRASGNEIILSLPSCGASVSPAGPPAAPAPSEFSKDFLRAGIEEMTVIREWRSALLAAVQNNAPVTEDWMATYRGQAATSLRLASVAVSTDSDRNAFQLLRSEFEKMEKLSNQVVSARKAMVYLSADALKDDPLNVQILGCARSLTSMAASGIFQDDGSCR